LNRIIKKAIYDLLDTNDIDVDSENPLGIQLRNISLSINLKLIAEIATGDFSKIECQMDFLTEQKNDGEISNETIDATYKPYKEQKTKIQISKSKNISNINYDNSVGLLSTKGGNGTGFIISNDGYVLTAYHVVEDEPKFQISLSAQKDLYDLTLVWYNPVIDIAILKIDSEKKDFQPLPIYTGDLNPAKGEDVVLLGYPIGGSLSDTAFQTENKIANFQTNLDSGDGNVFDTIFTYSNGTNGYSGGPLIRKSDNKVIAILHGGYAERGNINLTSDVRQLFRQDDLEIIFDDESVDKGSSIQSE
jgi:S1-C subfamily serine protease